MNPLLYFLIQCFVFYRIMGIQSENYALYLASGLIPWIFISQSLEMSAGAFVNNSSIIKSFSVNPLAFLFAHLLEGGFNFMMAVVILVLPLHFYYHSINYSLLLLPVFIFAIYITLAQLAFLVAYAQVFYRDIRFILTVFLNAAFFLTPIFYQESIIPGPYRWILDVNVFHLMIAPVQAILSVDQGFQWVSKLGYLGLWNILFLAINLTVGRNYRKYIYQYA